MTTRESLPQDVLEALSRGNKVEAIKCLRTRTGMGLKEAKELVDRHSTHATAPAPDISTRPVIPASVIAALSEGNKIEAIRLYREFAGTGLKEAKDAIDRLEVEHGTSRTELASGEVPRSRATWWLTLAISVACALAIYLLAT